MRPTNALAIRNIFPYLSCNSSRIYEEFILIWYYHTDNINMKNIVGKMWLFTKETMTKIMPFKMASLYLHTYIH